MVAISVSSASGVLGLRPLFLFIFSPFFFFFEKTEKRVYRDCRSEGSEAFAIRAFYIQAEVPESTTSIFLNQIL